MTINGFNFDTTYTTLPSQFFTLIEPEPVDSPKLVLLNTALAESIGLDFSALSAQQQTELFSGNKLPDGTTPFAQAYAGHQFGHFTLLGDGRAHCWGEHITPTGARLDIQFKGSGRTPYSRRGDGKAALGPMLREYIISEAMYHLGIPTTRSLAVITTGESVRRDELLPGAMLTRVASSHLRVGTFEFAARMQNHHAIQPLMDYTIQRHYPDLTDHGNKALALIETVMHKQAELIVHWMRVGFIHGVMNTDNMAVSGETIDYGPCAFMDEYHPDTVFSSIDQAGRYAYANQPKIAQWNLARLAETLLPLIDTNIDKAIALAGPIINQFPKIYSNQWLEMMRKKLGLFGAQPEDQQLANDLLHWMQQNHADYTHTFLDLNQTDIPDTKLYQDKSFKQWHQRWQQRLNKNKQAPAELSQLMASTNPCVIPRNHQVEHALNAAYDNDLQPALDLLQVLQKPYQPTEQNQPYQTPPKPNERVYQTFCGT